jgi:glycine/D-amino acid oxidase-like deaminating enzyme
MPESLWMATTAGAPEQPLLTGDVEADVCVIGAGVTGLTTALLLQRSGASVVILERDRVGSGVSGNTTAKVTALHGLIYAELQDRIGADGAATYASAQRSGLQRIEDFVAELEIDCDFRRKPAYTYAESPDHAPAIEAEVEAAQSAGLDAVLASDSELPFEFSAAVCLWDQAEFHPRKYLLALADAVSAAGGQLFERSPATDLSWTGTPTVTTTDGVKVRAGHVVVATLMPILDRGLWFTRLTPKRSYALAVRTEEFVPEGMYISADEPTRSIRAARAGDEELVIVGGEGHNTGEDPDTRQRYAALESFARKRLGATEVRYRWSAHDLQPADGVPYVGRYTPVSSNLLMAAGFRKWGFTNGTAAAMMLADRIAGTENPWEELFDASRITPVRSARGVSAEAVKDIRHLVGDRLRSPMGHTPRCTHLGCRLAWNTAENSWDCPCHGSRFAKDGSVLQGPATDPLDPKQIERAELPGRSG